MTTMRTDSQHLQNIADAIAAVRGESISMTPAQMAEAIREFTYDPWEHYDYSTVTWADGDLEIIGHMLDQHYAGKLDISDYWSVGDTRTISLSAMAATGVGESHVAQNVEWVIADFDKIPLTSPQGTRSNAAIVFTQKNFLANGIQGSWGYMNSGNTNSGGWNGCTRRTWCNNVYKAAIPSDLQGLLKQVNIVTASGNSSTRVTSEDYIFLPSEKEIFGSTTNADATAEFSLSQWQWFATSGNRVKKAGANGSANSWWERSPYGGNSSYFCFVNSSSFSDSAAASGSRGIAPSACI